MSAKNFIPIHPTFFSIENLVHCKYGHKFGKFWEILPAKETIINTEYWVLYDQPCWVTVEKWVVFVQLANTLYKQLWLEFLILMFMLGC